MLEELLGELHNWFVADWVMGDFAIADGAIKLPVQPQDGQYFRIKGSVFNDGLHQWPTEDLTDEEFNGLVALLAVPKAVQDLAKEIEEWVAKNPVGPYTSESFGGYSYSKATNPQTGQAATWQDVFRQRMAQWKKLPGCW